MKKTPIYVFLLFISLVLLYVQAYAVSNECSNCHTMHNSQDGTSLTGGAPSVQLLHAGCVGCHTADSGQVSTNGAPAILHINEPSGQGSARTLAAGDFYWVNSDEVVNSDKGHNVIDLPGISIKDANMPDFSPPGWDPDATGNNFPFGQVANGENTWSSQLTCAGTYGCHGNHNFEGSFDGIRGAHHTNTNGSSNQASVADSVGNSYRFLGAIKGLEEAGWNWNESSSTHNEYFGVNNTNDRSTGSFAAYGTRNTISFLCAECHGLFHNAIDADSSSGPPWVRHPTDISLPGIGEYALYNTPDGSTIGAYSVVAPIARMDIPATSKSLVTPGTDIVMCLSCHRAHGSNQNDLLRWDYSTMVTNGPNSGGCFVCHTTKNQPGVDP